MNSGYPSGLTAVQFELLIHYFYTPEQYPGVMDGHLYKAAYDLMGQELMKSDMRLTEKGLAFVRHILETPLPVHSWQVPEWPSRFASNPTASTVKHGQ